MTTFVIPAAGEGSRFSKSHPGEEKPLISVLGKPMIHWVVGNTEAKSGDTIVIIARQGSGLAQWRPTLAEGVNYRYFEIPQLSCGPACTVWQSMSQIPEAGPVVVLNSDQYVFGGLSGFCQKLNSLDESGLIMTMTATGTRWSFVTRSGKLVSHVAEKIEISNEATVGVYGWTNKELLSRALQSGMNEDDKVNGEYYIGPTFNNLISSGIQVQRHFVGELLEAIAGLGTPQDLEESLASNRFLAEINSLT